MKKYILSFISILFLFGLFAAASVFAEDVSKTKSEYRPCKNIVSACEKAGYFKGGHRKHQKKGLWKDCFQPIMRNQSVEGVSVSGDDVKACHERKAKRREGRKEKQENPVKKQS